MQTLHKSLVFCWCFWSSSNICCLFACSAVTCCLGKRQCMMPLLSFEIFSWMLKRSKCADWPGISLSVGLQRHWAKTFVGHMVCEIELHSVVAVVYWWMGFYSNLTTGILCFNLILSLVLITCTCNLTLLFIFELTLNSLPVLQYQKTKICNELHFTVRCCKNT